MIFVPLMVIFGIIHFIIAAFWGSKIGLEPMEIISLWREGLTPQTYYSGYEVAAVHGVNTGVLNESGNLRETE